MKKKRRGSIRARILLPVAILGISAVLSSFAAAANIRKVNQNAAGIADHNMCSLTELSRIKEMIQQIHNLALAHVTAVSSSSMIETARQIKEKESGLEAELEHYQVYVSSADKAAYQEMKEQYEVLVTAVRHVCAFSAARQQAQANEAANAQTAPCVERMLSAADSIENHASQAAQQARKHLAEVYQSSLLMSAVTILISLFSVAYAVYSANRRIIRPVIKAEQELSGIIRDIDCKEGDLTRRVSILSNDEIAALGHGINVFLEKLQDIFRLLAENSRNMDGVATQVLGHVKTSNHSVAEMSAFTGELSEMMESVSEHVQTISQNAEAVSGEVTGIAERTNQMNAYSKKMKSHAQGIAAQAHASMESADAKLNEILSVLNQAIEDSRNVSQVNSLTSNILNVANKTNLLALNASIEAARAGEAGKGFAVVAHEIGQLADVSKESASHIQEINGLVIQAVHNLAVHAQSLVEYMNEAILPEFGSFVKAGEEYRQNAVYAEGVMQEIAEKTDTLRCSVLEIADSIRTIRISIAESVDRISGASENMQVLAADMEQIHAQMDENKGIASRLKHETEIFVKL